MHYKADSHSSRLFWSGFTTLTYRGVTYRVDPNAKHMGKFLQSQ